MALGCLDVKGLCMSACKGFLTVIPTSISTRLLSPFVAAFYIVSLFFFFFFLLGSIALNAPSAGALRVIGGGAIWKDPGPTFWRSAPRQFLNRVRVGIRIGPPKIGPIYGPS